MTRLEWWEPDGAHMIREEESLVPTPSADRIAKMREDFADLLRILAPAWIAIGNARPVERPGEDLVVSEVASARYRSEQDDPVFIDAETLRDLLKLDDELWHASGDGRAFRARHRTESGLLPMPSPTDGATWAMLILHVGSRALHDVAREIAATPNLATLGQETTGWIADAVATGIRRELLRLVLRWNGGNLARVSDFVRAGGSGSVSKLLRKLDLGNAYLEHRQQGAGKPGPKRRSD